MCICFISILSILENGKKRGEAGSSGDPDLTKSRLSEESQSVSDKSPGVLVSLGVPP
jgi:hypothetical protein